MKKQLEMSKNNALGIKKNEIKQVVWQKQQVSHLEISKVNSIIGVAF